MFIGLHCYGHEDKIVQKTYGNTTVVIKTGFDYNEIHKIEILGQLTNLLTQEQSFKKKIKINFSHDYTNNQERDYFKINNLQQENTLYFKHVADVLNIKNFLKIILHFITLEKESLQENLTQIHINHDYHVNELLEITNPEYLERVIQKEYQIINDLINQNIPVMTNSIGNQIFWKNGQFIFYLKSDTGELTERLRLDNYLYHNVLNSMQMIVFKNQNSFYFLDHQPQPETKFHLNFSSYIPVHIKDSGTQLIIEHGRNSKKLCFFDKKIKSIISCN